MGTSDFKFLDISNLGSKINGNIMPVVNPNANSGGTPLFFEDYLYLQEMKLQRTYLSSEGDNSVDPPSNILSATPFYWLPPTGINQYNDLTATGWRGKPYVQTGAGDWINPSTTWDTPIEYYPPQGGGFSDILLNNIENWGMYNPPSKSPYYGMRPYQGQPLSCDEFIRATYYAYNQLTRHYRYVNSYEIFTTYTRNYYLSGNLTSTTTADANYYPDIIWASAYYDRLNKWYHTYDVQASQKSYGPFPYATSVKFFCATEIRGRTTYNRGFWLEVDGTINAGIVAPPAGLLDTLIDRACFYSGISKDNATVELHSVEMIVDFEFPARIQGWNWQPQYTS